MKNVALQLAHFKKLSDWEPQLYDVVIYHGWFTHWFGIVNGIDGGVVTVIQAGLPILLLTMDELDIPKNTKRIGVSSIRGSRAGRYAVLQHNGPNVVWFV